VSVNKRYCIFDSGSQVNIVNNTEYAQNWETCDTHKLAGMNGTIATNVKTALHPSWGTLYYVPQAQVCILSDTYVSQFCDIQYNKGESYTLYNTIDKRTYVFEVEDRLYKSNADSVFKTNSVSNVFSLSDTLLTTSRDINMIYQTSLTHSQKVQQYIDLHNKLGHASAKTLKALLETDQLTDCHLTPDDICECAKSLPQCEICLRGKIKNTKGDYTHEYTAPSKVGERCSTDLFYVNNVMYIGVWDIFSSYGVVMKLQTKSSLKIPILQIMTEYERHGHKIQELCCDGELVYTRLHNEAEITCKIHQSAPYRHQCHAERQVQSIHMVMRCYLADLDYTLPTNVYPYLVVHAQQTLNLLPHKNVTGIPYYIFHNKKISYKELMRFQFGCVVITTSSKQSQRSQVEKDKSIYGIVVGHDPLSYTGVIVYTKDNTFIRRNHCIPVTNKFEITRLCGLNPYKDSPDSLHHILEVNRAGETAVVEDLVDDGVCVSNIDTQLTFEKPQEVNVTGENNNCELSLENETTLREEMINTIIHHVFNLTIDEAIAKHNHLAHDAINSELQQMLTYKVWQYVHKSDLSTEQKRSLIPSSIFIKEKLNASGVFEKVKARIVAGGHRQKRDSHDVYSPTADITTLFTVIHLSIIMKHHIRTIDIRAAYLHADIDNNNTYMALPKALTPMLIKLDESAKEFVGDDNTVCVKLNKALYGLIQSAKLWNELITKVLTKHEFKTQNNIDHCLFVKHDAAGLKIVVLTVDDLFISSNTLEGLVYIENIMRKHFKDIVVQNIDKHNNISHLGLNINYDLQQGIVKITQPKYIHQLCHDSDTVLDTSVTYPILPSDIEADNKSVPHDADENVDTTEYLSTLHRLMYLATRSRPDILFATTYLSTKSHKPKRRHMTALSRIISYVSNTQNLALTYKSDPLHPVTYIDASFNLHDDAKSHTGAIFKLSADSGAVIAKSSKQKTVTDSSAGAELIALQHSVKRATWLRAVIQFITQSSHDMIIMQDNQSAIKLTTTDAPTRSGKGKWLNLRFNYIKNLCEEGEIIIEYSPTDEMIADFMTKPIVGSAFFKLRNLILGSDE